VKISVHIEKKIKKVKADSCSEAEFLDEIQTKVLRVFLLAIHPYSFA
jgi:hypothetical protein